MYIRLAQIIWGGFLMVLPSIVGRIMIALGVGYVTYRGFDAAVAWILNQIKSSFSGMPVEVVGYLGYLWVDKAIGMIFSAHTVAVAVKMAGGTSVTKMVTKAPAP